MATSRRAIAALGLLLSACLPAQGVSLTARELAELSLEELADIEVTSVSRLPEPLSGAAASIYVITGEEIRRSGASTLPEALRLAPNLQLGRINNQLYAISARGFQTNIANKLLVLVDGRTVYSPLFSGVFWDAQDVLLEDVERIEVIDGPGAATWGANAVNGVINVITRSAGSTQGMIASAGIGTRAHTAALRYGGTLGDGHYRVYGKGMDLDDTALAAGGGSARDGWERGQAGFRADWGDAEGSWTVQGDAYDASSDDRPGLGALELSGANLLGRYTRVNDAGSSLFVQAYYDRTRRTDLRLLQERAEIADLELKHGLQAGAHRILWGGGYRHAQDDSRRGTLFAFVPPRRELEWYSLFAQDQIRLAAGLDLTLGLRLEHNDYTGWETLPTGRLAWRLTPGHALWGAVSRAVRSPARLDREIHVPPLEPHFIRGGPDFESEIADVYELGYRAQPSSRLTLSLTAFHHRFDKLRSAQFVPGPAIVIANMIEGEISGLEAWGHWQAAPRWRLSWGGMLLEKDLRLKPGSTDPTGPSNLGNDADYQLQLRSAIELAPALLLDLGLRHIARLPRPATPSYTALDARLAWRASQQWEIALVLQDLLESGHVEFGAPAERSEFEPAALLYVRWER